MFLAVMQFSSIPKMKSDWSKTKLVLQGNDLLFSLDRTGIDWFNSTEVGTAMSRYLPENVLVDLEIKDGANTQKIIQNDMKSFVTVSYFKVLDGSSYRIIEIAMRLGYLYKK
jgi:hypothetical protein